MCLILQKVFLFLLVAFTFDGKVPSKTQHDINSVENKDHELFTNQYFAVADMIRSNCLKEQFHGSQSPIKLLRVSHCVIKSLIILTWFNLSI